MLLRADDHIGQSSKGSFGEATNHASCPLPGPPDTPPGIKEGLGHQGCPTPVLLRISPLEPLIGRPGKMNPVHCLIGGETGATRSKGSEHWVSGILDLRNASL
ncbi:hypothetical protein SAT01_24820 [Sinomonas atrocyanea]|nr:hypothetical protein SAT01_24820 [Sinomonas atrocyanea]